MSAEALILFVLFILLPLVEQVWRKWRDRRTQPGRRQPSVPPPVPVPPPIPRRPPGHAPLPSPAARDDVDDEVVASLPAPPSPPGRRKPAARPTPMRLPTAAQRMRQRPATVAPRTLRAQRPTLGASLRHSRELRRAVVLTTVLGPCRAIAPYREPDAG